MPSLKKGKLQINNLTKTTRKRNRLSQNPIEKKNKDQGRDK